MFSNIIIYARIYRALLGCICISTYARTYIILYCNINNTRVLPVRYRPRIPYVYGTDFRDLPCSPGAESSTRITANFHPPHGAGLILLEGVLHGVAFVTIRSILLWSGTVYAIASNGIIDVHWLYYSIVVQVGRSREKRLWPDSVGKKTMETTALKDIMWYKWWKNQVYPRLWIRIQNVN